MWSYIYVDMSSSRGKPNYLGSTSLTVAVRQQFFESCSIQLTRSQFANWVFEIPEHYGDGFGSFVIKSSKNFLKTTRLNLQTCCHLAMKTTPPFPCVGIFR